MSREMTRSLADLETRIVQHFRHVATDQECHEAAIAWHVYVGALIE